VAGSFSKDALSRRLRQLGNKSSIPSKHPDGNKPSFAGGGPMGRAAPSQFSSGGGFQGGHPYQAGAPAPPRKPTKPPITVAKANAPTPNSGIANDMKMEKMRLKTPNPQGTAAISRRLGF
jgi:hypothetical protein